MAQAADCNLPQAKVSEALEWLVHSTNQQHGRVMTTHMGRSMMAGLW